jgi:hypothetical protein
MAVPPRVLAIGVWQSHVKMIKSVIAGEVRQSHVKMIKCVIASEARQSHKKEFIKRFSLNGFGEKRKSG